MSKTEGGRSRHWAWAAALTVAAAAALRAYGLDSGLWYDEISTLLRSIRLPMDRLVVESPGVNAHPLYSVLGRLSILSLGESAWTLRLPAFLFGVASVWMVYVVGTRMAGRAEAWAGATILAASYHHIWFSQNARGYTMLGFFALAATFFLLRAGETQKRRDYALYAAVCAAAIYTHLTMVWMIAGHAVALAGDRVMNRQPESRTAWRALLWSWASVGVIAAVAYAPAMPALLRHFVVNEPPAAASVATPTWALLEAVRSMLSGAGVPAAIAAGALAVIGALSLLKRAPLGWALLVMPGVVTAAGLLILGQAIRPRFFFFLSGAAAVFAGRGIGVVAEVLRRPRPEARAEPSPTLVVLCVFAIVAAAAVQLPANYRIPKQDFEGALRFLEAKETEGARVAATGLACLPMNGYFSKTGWPCLESQDEFDAHARQSPSALVVHTLAEYIDDAPLQQRVLNECEVVHRFAGTLGAGDVFICRPRRQ